MDTYKCEQCGGVFEKGWSDEEAQAEADKLWEGLAEKDAAIVCDDCFKSLMASFN